MRRLSFVAGMLLMALLLPTVASASPITVIDPIIGVRGGMFGSEPVDSGQAISFAECPGAMDNFSLCAIFSITDGVQRWNHQHYVAPGLHREPRR